MMAACMLLLTLAALPLAATLAVLCWARFHVRVHAGASSVPGMLLVAAHPDDDVIMAG